MFYFNLKNNIRSVEKEINADSRIMFKHLLM